MRKLTILLIFILNFGIRLSWDDRTVSVEVGTRCWAADEEGDYEVPEGMHEQELEFDHEFTIKEPETGEETTVNTTITGSELYPDAIESSPPGFDVTPPELPDIDPDELDDLLDKIGPDIGSFDTESDTDLGGNPDIGPIVGPTTSDGGPEEEYEGIDWEDDIGSVSDTEPTLPTITCKRCKEPILPGELHNCNGYKDCAGVQDGLAYLDDCKECVGGNTGKEPCKAKNDDCAELEEMNSNDAMNNRLHSLAVKNSNNPQDRKTEHGYTLAKDGTVKNFSGSEDSQIKMTLDSDKKYTERAHTHPSGLAIPSAADLYNGLYKMYENGKMSEVASFRYLLVGYDENGYYYMNVQIADVNAFKTFLERCGGRSSLSKILNDKKRDLDNSDSPDDDLYKWYLNFLKEQNSGLNFMRKNAGKQDVNGTDWHALKVYKNSIINKKCN